MKTVITSMLGMSGNSLSHELLSYFDFSTETPTSSAFIQQRSKIKFEAFEYLFKKFSNFQPQKLYRGYRLFAIDGSDLHIATNPNDAASFYFFEDGRKSYNLLHLNAMYDLMSNTYVDAFIQKSRDANEHKALVDMIDKYSFTSAPAIVIADRGYESYNNMAHIQEKGWSFLFRLRDGKGGIVSGFDLPDDDFDVSFDLYLTKKQTNEFKELIKNNSNYKFIPNIVFDYLPVKNKKSIPVAPYILHLRLVRFKLTDNTYEVIATNLNKDMFPPIELKKLYAMRWGIETSFRNLKYTVGLLHFHSKKVEHIYQEIFARLIMYNFSELITSLVVIQQKHTNYCYKANFSAAVHVCRKFFLGKIAPPNVETLISRFIIPIRPNRKSPRFSSAKGYVSFLYRVA